MKKQNRYVSFIALLLMPAAVLCCLTGCSNGEEFKLIFNEFAGRYEITSIFSEQALDLNNDGIASNDLYSEYSSEFHYEGAPHLPRPFDFTDPYNFAYFHQGISGKYFAELRFPCQYFNEYPAPVPLQSYNWGLSNLTYHLADNGEVTIISPEDKGDEPVNNMGEVRSLQRLTKDIFQIDMTLKIYDFKQKKWVITSVRAVYERRTYKSSTDEE